MLREEPGGGPGGGPRYLLHAFNKITTPYYFAFSYDYIILCRKYQKEEEEEGA